MKSSIAHAKFASSALMALLAITGTSLAQSPENLDKRLTLVERKLDSAALGNMSNDLETLRQQMKDLRGELEQLQRQLQEINERQRSIYSDVDSRLRGLEQGSAGHSSHGKQNASDSERSPEGENQLPGTKHNSAEDTEQATDQSPHVVDPSEEHAAYQQAFNTLRDGRYALAQQQFQDILRRYPNGQYADNARYWLGESYYVGRHFEQAMEEFQKVLDEFPHSTKRPAAQLKIGFIQYEQGEFKKARKTLDSVIQNFPDSTAANLAQQRLRLIDNEQR